MNSRTSRILMRIPSATLLLALVVATAFAQEDTDPNSPTPILLSESSSTRALASPESGNGKYYVKRISSQAFEPNTRIALYLTNVKLMKGEGASAFRVYAIDKRGKYYRFPTIDLQQVADTKSVWALTTLLTDELRFWDAPAADGDLAIFITWRGLASNTLKLGLGQMGGGVGEIPNGVPTPIGTTIAKESVPTENLVGYRWSSDRRRLLQQATFGPTPALDDRVRRIGLRVWLNEQLESPYPTFNPYPKDPMKPQNIGTDPLCDGGADDVPAQCGRNTYTMYRPQTWFMQEAYYGEAQLRHRTAWALSQIIVTSGVDVQQGRHMMEFFQILGDNAFGNYKDILKKVTLNPAMGNYLDMAISTRTNPNENYAREIMQLFAVGLFKMNTDGTLQLDAQNNPIPTYDQAVVNDLTKVLTGWSFCNVATNPACSNLAAGAVNYVDPMILNAGLTNVNNNRHDLTAKSLLVYPGSTSTQTIPACTNCTTLANIQVYADNSLNTAIDNIYNHPNVGPFISKILIQHLVTSDPTPAYVGRVATVFNANRTNPKQLREVVKAILLDPEARGDVKTDPLFGKLREPLQLTTSVLREFGVRGAAVGTLSDGSFGVIGVGRTNGQIAEFIGMSQVPFLSPTVFNFYPPDYVVPGTSFLGPEFALMNTGTAIQRSNFMNRMIMNATPINAAMPDYPTGTAITIDDMVALATADPTGNALLDELNRRMMHGQMSAAMKSTILPAITSIASNNPTLRARTAIYLVATSSQYQVQR
ncbi:MAG: DUF1800 domain-containing protein [Blastocatellia bacterium]|nr:DUF1800 domain-containing protein [Blastocatellia bacterium]